MNLTDLVITEITGDKHILIAGPTASGKSSLALSLAQKFALPVVNADSLQVYSDWCILTARPSASDYEKAAHHLYGHVPAHQNYSVGDWLRDVKPLIAKGPCVVVGGTGLNFSSLTEGLVEIPEIPVTIRKLSDDRIEKYGHSALLPEIDSDTRAQIDQNNPRRVQRAWEVQQATGTGLAAWHKETGSPVLPLKHAQAIVLDAPKLWLTPRIETRFDLMLKEGVLDEAMRNALTFSRSLPSAKAIGASEMINYVQGRLSMEELREAVIIKTRQYAKRQRTWFRKKMSQWSWVSADLL